MSLDERTSQRHSRSTGALNRARPAVKLVIAGILVTVAYQASFGARPSAALYGGSDIGTGAAIGIGVGVAGVAAGIAAGSGAFGGGGAGGGAGMLANGDAAILQPLPQGTQIRALRLIPRNTDLDAGSCRVFDLQGRSASDHKWYSVTNNGDSAIMLRDHTPCVIKQEGSKNVFCVPITAPQSCNGQTVVIEGTYQGMTADARITVHVGGTAGVPAPQ